MGEVEPLMLANEVEKKKKKEKGYTTKDTKEAQRRTKEREEWRAKEVTLPKVFGTRAVV